MAFEALKGFFGYSDPYEGLWKHPGWSRVYGAQIVLPDLPEVPFVALEDWLSSLGNLSLCLSILGENRDGVPQVSFYVFSPDEFALRRAVDALQSAVGAVVKLLPDEEIGRLEQVMVDKESVVAMEAETAHFACLPLRTWDIFSRAVMSSPQVSRSVADPLAVLLSQMQVEPGEAVLYQIWLNGMAPAGWAEPYLWMLREDLRFQVSTWPWQKRAALMTGMIALGATAGGLFCWPALMWLRGEALGGAISSFVTVGFGVFAWRLGKRMFREYKRYEAMILVPRDMVREKLMSSALRVGISCKVGASVQRARRVMRSVQDALRLFDLEGGNCLQFHPVRFEGVFVPPGRFSLLSPREVVGMFHLPLGSHRLSVATRRTSVVPVAPAPVAVGGRRPEICLGVRPGVNGNKQEICVSVDSLFRSVLVVGKPRLGKSTVLTEIALGAIRQGLGLIMIDPHRDTLLRLLRLIPPERVDDVYLLDVTAPNVFGLNPLDMTQGLSLDAAVEMLVQILKEFWRDFWGPRMENALRYAARTVALLNLVRVSQGEVDRQLGILFIQALLSTEPRSLVRWLQGQLLNEQVRVLGLGNEVEEVIRWWGEEVMHWTVPFRQEVFSPVLSKLGRFANSEVLRAILSSPRSTVRPDDLAARGKIVLCNTGAMQIGVDLGSLIGSIVLGLVLIGFQRQSCLPPEQRRRSILVADEFQTLATVVPWGSFLGEMPKFGCGTVLATQSLAQLEQRLGETIGRNAVGVILGGIQGLICFGVSAEDAEILAKELGGGVSPEALRDLPDYMAYLRWHDYVDGGRMERIPVQMLETKPSGEGDPETERRIVERMAAYTFPLEYGLEMYRRSMSELSGASSAAMSLAALAGSGALGFDLATVRDAARAIRTLSLVGFSPPSGSVGRGLSVCRSHPSANEGKEGRP